MTLALRFFLDGPFFPEIIAGRIFASVPGELESILVSILGIYAEYLTAIGAAFALTMIDCLSRVL